MSWDLPVGRRTPRARLRRGASLLLAALLASGTAYAEDPPAAPPAAPAPGRPLGPPRPVPIPPTTGQPGGNGAGGSAGGSAGGGAGGGAEGGATGGGTTTTGGGTTTTGGGTTTGAGAGAGGGDATGEGEANPDEGRQTPPSLSGAKQVNIDFQNTDLYKLTLFFADLMHKNFIVTDDRDLKGKTVTIISHKPVSVNEAYDAFLQALEMSGYTTVTEGNNTRIVKSNEAGQSPIKVGHGTPASTAQYVTQIIQPDNVSVSDLTAVVTALASPEAKVISYAPSNTFIITDTSYNVKRIYEIINELDVAAPKSSLQIIPIQYAVAADIQQIIEQLYGTAESSSSRSAAASPARGTTRRPRGAAADQAPTTSEGVSAGKETKYIDKVLSDERTNSLIVLANDEGQKAVKDLVAQLDVDVDLSSRSQIHVVYLEHAKATDVAQVLANLSQSGSRTSSQQTRQNPRRPGAAGGPEGGPPGAAAADSGETQNVAAAFDSGMRIAPDDNTNSLVIIATPDDFAVVKQVIDQLDIRRRQVLIDAVILELGSDDQLETDIAFHGPESPKQGVTGLVGAQLGTSSLGLTQDLLSGLAVGVFGPTVTVPFSSGTGTTDVQVPAFGIVLSALRSNSSTDIVSNPNILTLDNEEAKIVVGRKVPFPTSTSYSQLGTPIVSYQREDVATTLKVTPRINSSDYVTLDVSIEVSEVEEDNKGLDVSTAGFITSKREVDTTALVGNNETVVLGGLVGTTDTKVETKVPILGDLPVVGFLFRGHRDETRKTNLMIFLTPHIVDDETDMVEIMKVKEAQRQEFIRRFYGKSREQQMQEIHDLLQYSMNWPGEASLYRTPEPKGPTDVQIGGQPVSPDTQRAVDQQMQQDGGTPGSDAGTALPVQPQGDDTSPSTPQPDGQ